ncbi:MAG: chemotaxis protein CheX [Deltaproteobacteria bacterium]|nr:chemotaxis protein CheX [Deltaproteobacteria bacterium]
MSSKFFGHYLLEKGRITSQQLLAALEGQKSVTSPIGTLALERGWVTAEQIRRILELQKKTNYRFGEQAVLLGIMTQDQVSELLEEQDLSHRVLLGEVLVAKGYLTLEALEKEFKEYRKEEERISAELAATFDKLQNKDLVKTFTDLMMIMFTRFAKQELKIEQCETGKEKVRLFRWVFLQKIAAENVEFKCLLSVPAKLLLQMASTMLDETVSTPDELALDASKEFVNIANGNACARLSENGLSFTMAPPEVYETTSKPYAFQAKDVVCVHLSSPDSKLEVAFEF